MKNLFTTLCLIGLVALVSIPSSAQKTTKTAPGAKISKPPVVFNYGSTEGQIYTNDFLGLKLTVPEDLMIQDREIIEAFLNYGKAESKKSKVLLMAETSEHASFICLAKKLGPSIKNLTAKQIFQAVVAQRNSATPWGVSFSTKIKQQKFGSNALPFLDSVSNIGKQRIFAMVKKGYLIIFILTYLDDSELKTMSSILADADFNWKKS